MEWPNDTVASYVYNVTEVTTGMLAPESPVYNVRRQANIYRAVGVFGLTGNLLVIIVMLSSPSMYKKIPNMYIIHQSFIDFLVSVILIATAMVHPLPDYEGTRAYLYCLFWKNKTVLWILLLCSTYNLVALTLERYMEIVFPIFHKLHFNRDRAIASLLGVWLFCAAFDLAGKMPTTYLSDGGCYFLGKWPSVVAQKSYGIMVVIVKFFIPLTILVYCYGHIAFILHKKITDSSAGAGKESRLQRGRRNTIKTLALVAAAFILCWSCNQFYFVFYNAGYNLSLQSDFYHFGVVMDFINSCINPIIYVFQFEQFQTAGKRLFFKIFNRSRLNQVGPTENSIETNA